MYGIIGYNIINCINLRSDIIRLKDYPISHPKIKSECITYNAIDRLIMKHHFPTIKFINDNDLDVLKQRYYRSIQSHHIRKDWNESNNN